MQSKQIFAPQKETVAIRELDIPAPGPREVQVRAEASIVSPGTERAFISGMVNTSGIFPQNLGYSCAGVVTQVGEQVQGFRPGDRVAGIMFHQSLSNCAQEKLVHVPDGVCMRDASFVRIGVISMQGVRKARIELGESCVILGMGLIGQVAMQLARANGAYPVIAVDRVPSKLELARQCGADIVIDANQPDYIEQVLQATGGAGARVVIESTGFPGPINDALLMAPASVGLSFSPARAGTPPSTSIGTCTKRRLPSSAHTSPPIPHRRAIRATGASRTMARHSSTSSPPGACRWRRSSANTAPLPRRKRYTNASLAGTRTM